MTMNLIFDWTSIFGLLAIGQTASLLIYLLIQIKKHQQFYLPFLLLFTIMIALLHDVLLHSKLALYFPHILGFGPFVTYLVGPLVLILSMKIISPEKTISQLNWLHFLPFVIQQFNRIPSYLNSAESKLDFLNAYYDKTEKLQVPVFSSEHLLNMLLFYGHRFVYLFYALYLLNKFKSDLQHCLPSRLNFSILLRQGIYFYCIGWTGMQLFSYLPNTSFWIITNNTIIQSLALSLLVIILSHFCMNNPMLEIFNIKTTKKYQKSGLNDELAISVYNDIYQFICNEEIFSNSELKLSDIAQFTGFTPHQISQAINTSTGNTLNQLLNEIRLKKVKEMLSDSQYQEWDIQKITMEAGFNSKATFNRAFKKAMGVTPSQFRKSIAANK